MGNMWVVSHQGSVHFPLASQMEKLKARLAALTKLAVVHVSYGCAWKGQHRRSQMDAAEEARLTHWMVLPSSSVRAQLCSRAGPGKAVFLGSFPRTRAQPVASVTRRGWSITNGRVLLTGGSSGVQAGCSAWLWEAMPAGSLRARPSLISALPLCKHLCPQNHGPEGTQTGAPAQGSSHLHLSKEDPRNIHCTREQQ